jgi:uncharacterized membrane protein YdjX (TVP38/TMEM64 family)
MSTSEITMAQPTRTTSHKRREILISISTLIGGLAIGALAVHYRQELRYLVTHAREWGPLAYGLAFGVNLISSASLFLPIPGFAMVFALGNFLNPWLLGIISGLGAALGETTGYFAGLGGRAMLEDSPWYQRFHKWISRYGMVALIVLAASPNPFFDMGGLIAGATGMPLWQFVAATWIGKSIRFTVLAVTGMQADLILEWLFSILRR